jgi:MFS family permease
MKRHEAARNHVHAFRKGGGLNMARFTETLLHLFRALRHRNYRLFFFGQGVSLIGSWMQTLAMGWLVYRLTDSKMLLGFVPFCSQIPSFFLAPLAGVWVGRADLRKFLAVTQSLLVLPALVLALLFLTKHIQVWHIIALSLCVGFINAFDVTGRQSFVVKMVDDKADLGNAIALNSMLFNSARLVGPAIAGFVVDLVGEGVCFLLNAVSFLAVVFSLLAMRIKPHERLPKRYVLHEMREGLSYAFRFVQMRWLLLQIAMISLMVSSYAILMPVFAKDILHGGAKTLGILQSSVGVGALMGAIYLAARGNAVGLEKIIMRAVFLLGTALVAFSQSRVMPLSMFCLALAGFGMMVNMASSNTVIQTIVDDDKRGRVMSFYTMSFMGMAPFGNLLAGALASWISAPGAVCFAGLTCMAAVFLFAPKIRGLDRVIRAAYGKKKELPTVPDAPAIPK